MPLSSSCLRRGSAALCLILTLAALLALAGCGASPAPTPTPTKTPISLVVVIDTPAPAATLPPTDTPIPPTETPVPPTETPTLTTGPTPTPTEEPTPTPDASLIVPATDASVFPFTGLRPQDPAHLARRPLAIKVANQASVNPQSGLNMADVVVESRVEYSETRYTVIYHSQSAERVGSIRSARLIDRDLPVIFDAVLCFSGAVQPVREMLYSSDLSDQIIEQALNGPSYYRDPNINVPDNLFADTAALWNTVAYYDYDTPPQPTGAFFFRQAPPDAPAASRVDIPYPRFAVRWTYDPGSGRWLRQMGGNPHIDAVSGEQLSAANVVVLGVNHVTTLILEHGSQMAYDNAGNCINCSIEIQLWGEGPLKILRDGKVVDGKWVRAERFAPFRFLDAGGNDIPLKPGNSWWQVTPLGMGVSVQ